MTASQTTDLQLQFASPLGLITVIRNLKGISKILIGGPVYPIFLTAQKDEILDQCEKQLSEYFQGTREAFDLPLDWDSIKGFQRDVLQITMRINYGKTSTYGAVACALGKPAASRAVGGALARNPIPILIPCHRVIAASGALTGYSAADGIATKAHLLKLEGHRIVAQKLG